MFDADITLYAYRQLVEWWKVRPANSAWDLIGLTSGGDPWIWRWRPWEAVEGTSKVGIVLARHRGWAVPNRHNTLEFPLLQVEIYADPARGDELLPERKDAEEKALAVGKVVKDKLHVPLGKDIWWGNEEGRIRVVSSLASSEIGVEDVPDGDGMVRGLLTFDVEVG